MSKRANEYQVVGTSALKADAPRFDQAKIIAFPGAAGAPSASAGRQASMAARLRDRALDGITRESLQGRPFGRMTKGQAVAFGTSCFLFAVVVTLIGL